MAGEQRQPHGSAALCSRCGHAKSEHRAHVLPFAPCHHYEGHETGEWTYVGAICPCPNFEEEDPDSGGATRAGVPAGNCVSKEPGVSPLTVWLNHAVGWGVRFPKASRALSVLTFVITRSTL